MEASAATSLITPQTYLVRLSVIYEAVDAKQIAALAARMKVDAPTIEAVLGEMDPTPNREYWGWLAKQLKFGNIQMPNAEGWHDALYRDVRDILGIFHRAKRIPDLPIHRDINKYERWPDFRSSVLKIAGRRSRKKDRGELKSKGYKIVSDEDGFQVRLMLDPYVAAEYSKGTKWCTTDPRTAESYMSQGRLYVVFATTDDGRLVKVAQAHPKTGQRMDLEDKPLKRSSGVLDAISNLEEGPPIMAVNGVEYTGSEFDSDSVRDNEDDDGSWMIASMVNSAEARRQGWPSVSRMEEVRGTPDVILRNDQLWARHGSPWKWALGDEYTPPCLNDEALNRRMEEQLVKEFDDGKWIFKNLNGQLTDEEMQKALRITDLYDMWRDVIRDDIEWRSSGIVQYGYNSCDVYLSDRAIGRMVDGIRDSIWRIDATGLPQEAWRTYEPEGRPNPLQGHFQWPEDAKDDGPTDFSADNPTALSGYYGIGGQDA